MSTAGTGTTPVDPAASAAVDRVRELCAGRRRRAAAVAAGLAVVLLGAMAVRVLLGRYTVTIPDFLAIVGGATLPGASFVVLEEKLPRAVLAALVGCAFGASGALFRRVLGNPLASPDILGVTYGASAGAVAGMALWGLRGTAVVPAALAGATVALALVLAASAGRRTGIVGQRFLLGGVAVAALATAVVTQLVARLTLTSAHEAVVWTVGSLSGASAQRITWLGAVLVVVLPAAAWLHRALRPAELGPELAVGLGARPVPTRAAALGVGVVLAATATAVSGPLAFVALLATPVATALGGGRPRLLAAALVGAVLVVSADVVAAEALGRVDLPTGVVTGALGAPAMLWILLRSRKAAS
ncbi:FecCD family ABC transporter permease [Dietzia sp. 179-F 9C3 NHS]|uniref:FecCD family ABC transporter permease n=1 Tax=Dietzia sp. 179-F 9C3 NHS TaxID=3374295 RepID=UPI00387A20FE